MIDPRKAGLASRADHWLRVRPGTDAALALSLTHVMIENGWYDRLVEDEQFRPRAPRSPRMPAAVRIIRCGRSRVSEIG